MRIDEKKFFLQCAKKGLTYKELARALGVTTTTAYGYRKHNVRPDTVNRIAKALGCEPGDLL